MIRRRQVIILAAIGYPCAVAGIAFMWTVIPWQLALTGTLLELGCVWGFTQACRRIWVQTAHG